MRGPIYLSGFMATGKSTVGQTLADQLGVPFVDLDREIEAAEGCSIAEIFARQGEASFRALEQQAVREQLKDSAPRVIALGGGALLGRQLRLEVLDRATVVTLTASEDELLKRAARPGAERPLLRNAALDWTRTLLEQRAPAYAECHGRVDTTGKSPREIAEEVETVWRREGVAVAAGSDSYRVEIGTEIAEPRLLECVREATRVVIVTDTHVAPLHLPKIRSALASVPREEIVIEAGEEHKNLATLETIWQRAKDAGCDRGSVFLGLGGGVVTDITGFAAAGWMRGVPWIGVPTTLLSMVDASVGGKTAVDLGVAKNCVGAFWQPARVFCDIALAATEPPRGFSAMSEVVKTALIGDPDLLGLVESGSAALKEGDPELTAEVVRRCVRVKARVVSEDAREGGFRAALNLGHTIGHALEAVGGYARLTHGEAISLGLVAALRLGDRLGVTPKPLETRIATLLSGLGLPTDLSREPLAEAAELLGLDKKRKGKGVRFVLCDAPGSIRFRALPLDELAELTKGLGTP